MCFPEGWLTVGPAGVLQTLLADSGAGVLQTLLAVEKAIRESPLQLNPRVDGQEVLVPVPQCAASHC